MVVYRVRERLKGGVWKVLEYPDEDAVDEDPTGEDGKLLHEGSLADCEAFIRLRDRGCL